MPLYKVKNEIVVIIEADSMKEAVDTVLENIKVPGESVGTGSGTLILRANQIPKRLQDVRPMNSKDQLTCIEKIQDQNRPRAKA